MTGATQDKTGVDPADIAQGWLSPRRLPFDTACTVVGFVFAIAGAQIATAQEYCVSCTGPDAIYRCVIDGSSPQGVPLKMLCISRLAEQGGHATCAVKGGTVFDCSGPIRRIDTRAPPAAATVPPPIPIAVPPASESRPAAKSPSGGPASTRAPPDAPPAPAKSGPQTVEALAKEVTAKSGSDLKKAGNAIKNGTQKAWDCVASFFKSC